MDGGICLIVVLAFKLDNRDMIGHVLMTLQPSSQLVILHPLAWHAGMWPVRS